jgi:hypothetical protein
METSTPELIITTTSAVYPTTNPTATIEIPLITPIQTLVVEESQAVFQQWLLGDNDCRLPCWAGVVPGETSWEEAYNLIASVLTVYNVDQEDSCRSGPCSKFSWRVPTMEYSSPAVGSVRKINNDFVTDISLTIQYSYYPIPLDQVFIQYGLPQQVLIHAAYYRVDNYVVTYIILFYPESDFILRFFRSGWLSGGNIWSCGPFGETDLRISNSIESNWNIELILLELDGNRSLEYPKLYYDMEEITEFSIESFAEMFISDPNACFEIKLNN